MVCASDQLAGVNVIVLEDKEPLLGVSWIDTSAVGSLMRCRSKVAVCTPSLLIVERIVLNPVRPFGVITTDSL